MTIAKSTKLAGGGLVLALIMIQFFRPERANPPSNPGVSFEAVVKPPQELASSLKRACNDCHSNQTTWPWYSNIAPASWLIASDVTEGRAHLNFSDWTQAGAEGEKPELGDLCSQVQAGKMPLRSYTVLHPEAKLSRQETAALCALATAPQQAEEAEPRSPVSHLSRR